MKIYADFAETDTMIDHKKREEYQMYQEISNGIIIL
jgi:hypothetical protein